LTPQEQSVKSNLNDCLSIESVGCTFIRMTVPSFPCRFTRHIGSNLWKLAATFSTSLPVLFALLVLLGSSICSWARTAKTLDAATLVETETYIPCGDGCSLTLEPARAFCVKLGDQYLVGEGRSYLHEGKFTGFEDLAGKQLPVRFSRRSMWLRPPDRGEVKLARGSEFEGFKNNGCVAAVHGPILQHANAVRRPLKVPPDAVAIAGPEKGEFRPLYLWFQCGFDSSASTIDCREWYKSGEAAPPDWYCARSIDGAPARADFALDPLLSQAGRLVLKSGAVLQHDNRGRTNGQLDRPGEACR
jgi:hypothetical protein